MREKNVSLKMIAMECGVSINTVSHALRDMDDISEDVKSKIRQCAIRFGYMPNHLAQSMIKNEKQTVAVITNSTTNLYFNSLYGKLIDLFRERAEYNIIMLFSFEEYLDNAIVKQCVLQRVDLIITHQYIKAGTLELLKLHNIQVVTVGSKDYPEYDNISVDNRQGCNLAAKYLVSYCDHGAICYVGVNYYLSDLRFQYFKDAVKMLTGDEVIHFNMDSRDTDELFQLIYEGCRRIFFYSDATLYECTNKFKKKGIDIIKLYSDLHCCGFDGLCEVVTGLRDITTIKINYDEFAFKLYTIIHNRLENANIGH